MWSTDRPFRDETRYGEAARPCSVECTEYSAIWSKWNANLSA